MTEYIKNIIGIVLTLLACGLVMHGTIAAADEKLPKGIIKLDGKPAPQLKLTNMDGEAFDLTQAKGRWVFVHFWASWCGPCRKEMPTIQTMSNQLLDQKLTVVLINTAETDDTVFSFMGIVAPDLTPLMDYDGTVTESWQPRGLPSTFLVDPHGALRYLALGGRPWNKPEYIQFLQTLISRNPIHKSQNN